MVCKLGRNNRLFIYYILRPRGVTPNTSRHQHGRYKLLNADPSRSFRSRTRCAFQSFAARAQQCCDYLAKGETMNYRTLISCQNQPKSLTPCPATSADDTRMLVLMSMEPPQHWNMWIRNRICVSQTREESNGHKPNLTFAIPHGCSVRADGERAAVARALHEINRLR